MEIRQVLKSSASMIPVLFYKISDRQTKPAGEEKYSRGRERKRNQAEKKGSSEKIFKQSVGKTQRVQTGRVKAIQEEMEG